MPPFFSGPSVPAILALADGTIFKGYSIGAVGHTTGEVVFNTAMTGYQEILTDPSYSRQIVTLTYPHIGNYGVNTTDVEASKVHAAGLIIRDLPLLASNFRSTQSLGDYLKAENVVAIAGIDTRKQLEMHILGAFGRLHRHFPDRHVVDDDAEGGNLGRDDDGVGIT